MLYLESLTAEISKAIIRAISGRIFSAEEVRAITQHTIGKHFSEFFPRIIEESEVSQQVNEARHHIDEAGRIVAGMQTELESQSRQLDHILREVEEKKQVATRYEALAKTSRVAFAAFRQEMEDALREELTAQNEKGRNLRRTVSIGIWVLTLVGGAGLDAYFKDIIGWVAA